MEAHGHSCWHAETTTVVGGNNHHASSHGRLAKTAGRRPWGGARLLRRTARGGLCPLRHHHHHRHHQMAQWHPTRPLCQRGMTASPEQEESEIETYLAENYPSFYNLLLRNAEDVLKALRKPDQLFTIFAPNDAAFERLEEKKIQQLRDPRNLEATNKIAAFHVVVDDSEVVTAEAILDPNSNIGGVLTLGGEVPIGPSESGGFFGMGATPDGGIVVGPKAKIVQSLTGPRGVVHEVDAMVAPNLVWRYMDQLRLPGL